MAEPKSFWARMSGVFRSGPPAGNLASGDSTTSSAATGALSPDMPARALAANSEDVPWWRRRQMRQAQARGASLRVMD